MSGDFTFSPQIAQNYISGYWRKKLLWASLGMKVIQNFQTTPGNTLTFPYYNTISAAVDGTEGTRMAVDNLTDNQFTVTIKEVVKAVGRTDAAMYAHGNDPSGWEMEAHNQIARVFAEKVDADVLTEISKSGSGMSVKTSPTALTITSAFGTAFDPYVSSSAFRDDAMNVRTLATGITDAFGDKTDEIAAIIMHSKQWNDLNRDNTAGYLKADSNHPLMGLKGYKGVFSGDGGALGIPVFVNDQCPKGSKLTITDSASATKKYQSYKCIVMKKNAWGVVVKQEPKIEYGRDQLARQDYMSCTQWYGTKSFNQVIDTEDVRQGFIETLTTEVTT